MEYDRNSFGISGGTQTYARIAQLSLPGRGDAEPAAADTRNFAALSEMNPDVVAWLSIPDTNINYPIVQGTDNSYYLTHLFTGQENSSGSLFLDYLAAPDFSDPYSIIYGHNMLNGSMFADLTSYKTQSFADAHAEGVLETPDGCRTIRFFAGFVADSDNAVWDGALVERDFLSWRDQMTRQSYFQSSCIPAQTDHILALSTCSYEYDDARFVLLGVLQ